MAVTRDRSARIAAAGLIALLAVLSLAVLPAAAPQAPDVTEIRDLIEEIRSGAAEDEASAVAEEPQLVPMASPCLMRRPRMALQVPQDWRHGFAAATLATDPALRQQMLLQLAERAPDDLARWRIDIALAERALRLGDTADVTRALTRAASRTVPDSCRADEAFLAATQADPAAAALLLDQAVALDPAFWAAHERLAVLAVTGTGSDPAACQDDAVRTMQSVVQLAALARYDTQFQRLERAVVALPTSGRSALLLGMVARQTGDTAGALTLYREGLAALGDNACDAVLREGLTGMITATESTQ